MQEGSHYRLVIADDHPLYRGALRAVVSGLLERADIAEAGTFDELVELLEQGGDFDLVLLDLTLQGMRGLSGVVEMRAKYPSVPVAVVSADDDPAAMRRAIEIGASGFIPKALGADVIRSAVSHILGGGVWTPPDVNPNTSSHLQNKRAELNFSS